MPDALYQLISLQPNMQMFAKDAEVKVVSLDFVLLHQPVAKFFKILIFVQTKGLMSAS